VKHTVAVLLTVSCLFVAGCGEESSTPASSSGLGGSDGANLLGLTNNRTLTYLQTDTIVVVDSTYEVTVPPPVTNVVKVSGSSKDWVVDVNDVPALNFKLTNQSVLLNGYWDQREGHNSLFYFAVPPIIMNRSLKANDPWAGYTPFFGTETENQRRPIYNCYFGFFFTRTYIGREEVIVPAGQFQAWRFEVELFTGEFDQVPSATVVEHYVSGTGLARLHWRGGSLNRTLSLISAD